MLRSTGSRQKRSAATARGLTSCGKLALWLGSMRDLPGPRIKPVSPQWQADSLPLDTREALLCFKAPSNPVFLTKCGPLSLKTSEINVALHLHVFLARELVLRKPRAKKDIVTPIIYKQLYFLVEKLIFMFTMRIICRIILFP